MLTQLSTLKIRLGLSRTDLQDDTILTNAIKSLSVRLENDLNRKFCRVAGATFEFRADEMDLVVDRYPIERVTLFEVKSTETKGWLTISPAPDYTLNEKQNLIALAMPLGTSRQLGRVTFDAGYVLPGGTLSTGQTALPDDLEQAVVEQIAWWYARRNQLGLVSISGDGGSATQFHSLDLLPNCAAIFKNYARWLL